MRAELGRLQSEFASGAPLMLEGRPTRLRRRLMQKYPYSIIYRVRRAEIEVIAISHFARQLGYWRRR